jgi:hypothetical protein
MMPSLDLIFGRLLELEGIGRKPGQVAWSKMNSWMFISHLVMFGDDVFLCFGQHGILYA